MIIWVVLGGNTLPSTPIGNLRQSFISCKRVPAFFSSHIQFYHCPITFFSYMLVSIKGQYASPDFGAISLNFCDPLALPPLPVTTLGYAFPELPLCFPANSSSFLPDSLLSNLSSGFRTLINSSGESESDSDAIIPLSILRSIS